LFSGACSSAQPASPTPMSSVSASRAPNAPGLPVTSTSGIPAAVSARGGRAATTGVVFVRSQGLYYDTFATADQLPPHGRFQQLYDDGSTDYGPGDPGYVGGRWWVDVNHNDMQDPGDTYFLCPLLGPGRETP
jgi:hypothetical protein